MEYKKKIKLWVTALLATMLVAGAVATIFTQKYQLFKGNYSMPSSALTGTGTSSLPSASTSGVVNPSTPAAVGNTLGVVNNLLVCETMSKTECANNTSTCTLSIYSKADTTEGYKCESKQTVACSDIEKENLCNARVGCKWQLTGGGSMAIGGGSCIDAPTLDISLADDSPKGQITAAEGAFVTVAKYKLTAIGADAIPLNKITFSTAVKDASAISFNAIESYKFLLSVDGTEANPTELSGDLSVNDTGTQVSLDMSGKPLMRNSSSPRYLIVKIKLKAGLDLGAGKNFSISISNPQDVVTSQGIRNQLPAPGPQITFVRPVRTLSVVLSGDSPAGKNVKTDETQFTAAIIAMTASDPMEISGVDINLSAASSLKPEDIKSVQLLVKKASDKEETSASGETTYDSAKKTFPISLTKHITFTSKNETQSLFVKARLRQSAQIEKKFSFGIASAGSIHIVDTPAVSSTISINPQGVYGKEFASVPLEKNITVPLTKEPAVVAEKSKATLAVSVFNPEGQAISIPSGIENQVIKAIGIDVQTSAAQLSKLSLKYTGTLPVSEISKLQVFSRDGSEYTTSSIEKNSSNGNININFSTLSDQTKIADLPQQKNSYILYVTASPTDDDGDKSIQYSLTDAFSNPAPQTPQTGLNLIGQSIVIKEKEVVVTPEPLKQIPTPSSVGQSRPAASATQTCESKGKYTYTGKKTYGSTKLGDCIACATDIFVKNNGKCTAKKTTTKSLSLSAASTEETPPSTETQTSDQMRSSAADYTPTLVGSQKLVSAPERGNTGPEIIFYFLPVAAINGLLWLKRKRINK